MSNFQGNIPLSSKVLYVVKCVVKLFKYFLVELVIQGWNLMSIGNWNDTSSVDRFDGLLLLTCNWSGSDTNAHAGSDI